MRRPGITVRPIINLEMHDEFCETFFDNVRVPKENLVGQLNKGWDMAKALLGFERIFLGSPRQSALCAVAAAAAGGAHGRVGGRAVPGPLHAAAAGTRGPEGAVRHFVDQG